jgi:DNA-binding Xre family transcriptional regulator
MKKRKYPGLVAEMVIQGETQKELAKVIGITPMAMSYKMTGKNDFTISEVEKICEHYKKNYYELFR